MIDDKKIEEAKEAFIADKKILGIMAMNDLACGFKEGAKWAINDFLKDLWHHASEKPNIKAKRKLCEIRSNLTDDEQKQAIWIAIRAIDTCTENGFIVED